MLLSQGNGGLEKHVRELSTQLHSDGINVVVIADKSFLNTLPAEIACYAIPAGLSRYNPILLYRLYRVLSLVKADIIHAQANKAVSVLAVLKPWLKTKTLGTLHNIKRHLQSFTRLDHTIAVSHQLAKPFKTNISVVYNGISEVNAHTNNLKRAQALAPDLPVLCAVGRLVEAKGFDSLLKAVNGLPINLLIIGEGPQRPQLEAQIKALNSNTHCHLLGQREDVAAVIASTDAVLISSRREGFSYVLCEALMLGKRILSTDVPVANEILPSELITAVSDPIAFRSRLTSLLNDMPRWSALMQKPQQRARQEMTLAAMSANTISVYKSVITDKTC